MAATILICTPIFLPICQKLGMDPVQFGMVMLINCALGLNTPPVGTTQFVGCAIGGVSIGYVMRTIWPFYGALVAALMLVTYVPGVLDVAAQSLRLQVMATAAGQFDRGGAAAVESPREGGANRDRTGRRRRSDRSAAAAARRGGLLRKPGGST